MSDEKPKPPRKLSKAPPPIEPLRGGYGVQARRDPPAIDWHHWTVQKEVRLWEAVFLSLGLNPEIRDHYSRFIEYASPETSRSINKRLTTLKQYLTDRTHFSPCTLNIGDSNLHGVHLPEFAAWCARVGYRDLPNELAAIANAPALVSAQPQPSRETATAGTDWKAKAREIADELYDRDTTLNCRNSLNGYASKVMDEMQRRGIKGPRGIIDNVNTVQREALQGALWWAKKAK